MHTRTVFGSLRHYQKGGVQVIDDNPKDYAFSNVFDVAARSRPYEKVAVGKNLKYVIETLRAEGTSPWFLATHDEAALVMDGDIVIRYVKPAAPLLPAGVEGSVPLAAEPPGEPMGWVRVRRGHMALLPGGAAYQFRAVGDPGVLLLQTIKGSHTIERWADICQTA
jgi:hypothetical protein